MLQLGGPGSPLHQKHRLYLEFLAPGFPFLPVVPIWHAMPLPRVSRLRVEALDVTDVVVSKLARFHRVDRDDIAAMVTRGQVGHTRMIERFRSAVSRVWHDARADDLPRIVGALHRVERDLFGVAETSVDLPPWIDDE